MRAQFDRTLEGTPPPEGDKFTSWPAMSWAFKAWLDQDPAAADKARDILQRTLLDNRAGTAISQDIHHAPRLLAAARIWVRPSTPAASLAAMVRTDPVPGVRARALLLLATIDTSLTLARELAGPDGLASTEVDRLVAAVLIAEAEGTAADVQALHTVAAQFGRSPEREAAEAAIAAIQARAGPGAVGALSVSGVDGELSLAAHRGDLSLGRRG
jgi:hypothetical protein